ncbi:MAG TPA: type II secretion system F family protein [Alphaproteobacteria bacterium]|nr:type II secretion system F family protein [Alphaproteobacteria bacterium]
MKHEKEKSEIHKKNFKDELIESSDIRVSFKDSKNLTEFKDKINSVLKTHFDEKTFEKEQKDAKKAKSRFDKKQKKGKKIIGLFSDFSLRLNIDMPAREINKMVVYLSIFLTILISLVVMGFVIANDRTIDILLTFWIFIWTLGLGLIYLLLSLLIFIYLDMRMYAYVKQIEENLPDFLQLASANISAGMTVDRALWYAVRPKFGILAKEMETVAKSTIAGEDLEKALSKLTLRYESRILRETINLIIEGIQSGGEIADLLNKLSTNIKETQLMRKEISASVTTYAIFIGVATVGAAPILFALSTQLLIIIQQIFGSINIDTSTGPSGLFSLNFSGESIKLSDFRRFAILVLCISSFFSAAIISTIQKGTIKDGVKTIPIFMIISIVLYYLASNMFQTLMGGMFGN